MRGTVFLDSNSNNSRLVGGRGEGCGRVKEWLEVGKDQFRFSGRIIFQKVSLHL